MPIRIKDLNTTTTLEEDDYIVVDGNTSGTRKTLASNVGGEKMYDFTSTITTNIDSRGVTSGYFIVIPVDTADAGSIEKAIKMRAYLQNSSSVAYPLIVTYVSTSSTSYNIQVKSLNGNPQNTTSTTVTGTLHIVAPFEISNVVSSM